MFHRVCSQACWLLPWLSVCVDKGQLEMLLLTSCLRLPGHLVTAVAEPCLL